MTDNQGDFTPMVGERIRQKRKELGYSLRELGARANLTASFLSQVENGQCSPSLSSLQRIAIALEVPMFAFLETAPSPNPVIRAEDRPRLHTSDADIVYELLSRDLSGQLMAVLIRIRPGGRRIAEELPKPTDELMYVLKGRLSITLADQTYTLGPGDSISYKGRSLREFAAADNEETWVICCITPPVL
jgi:transcriptional regulator with XRE-family HTH domain